MAHTKHVHTPGGIYLVSSIAERGRAVFADDSDRVALGRLVGQVIARCGAQVHAYGWLESELLMVLQVSDVSLSTVMQRIASRHARRVNGRLGYRGALFRHPHRALLLEDAVSVLEAVATVHRSPVSAWSSHNAYLGDEEVPWLTKHLIMGVLSATLDAVPSAYATFMAREEVRTHTLQLRPPASSRRRHWGVYDEFLASLRKRSIEHAKPASLDDLIQAVARWLHVDPALIGSNSSSPVLSLARALITGIAMQNGIASLAELARRLDRRRSTLHEIREMYRDRAPQLFAMHLTEILTGPGLTVSEVLRLIEARPKRPPPPAER